MNRRCRRRPNHPAARWALPLIVALAVALPSFALTPTQAVVGLWDDRALVIMDVDTGVVIGRYDGLPSVARNLAMRRDGRLVAVACDNATLVIDVADPTSPRLVAMAPENGSSVGVGWTADGMGLVTSTQSTGCEWYRFEGDAIMPLGNYGAFDDAPPVALSDGRLLVAAGDEEVGLIDASSLASLAPSSHALVVVGTPGREKTWGFAVTADATHVLAATGTADPASIYGPPRLNVISARDARLEAQVELVEGRPSAVEVVRDAAWVLDADNRTSGRNMWLVRVAPIDATAAVTGRFDLGVRADGWYNTKLARLVDGRLVTSSSLDGVVVVFDPLVGSVQHVHPLSGAPTCVAAAPAARAWLVKRGVSPSVLDDVRSPATMSPFDDGAMPAPALLGDGRFLCYDVSEPGGPPTLLRVDKATSLGTVRLSWRDFDADDARVDPTLSVVDAEIGCRGLGLPESRCHARLRDAVGDPVGIVEGLVVDPANVTPARIARPPQSTPDGTWFSLASDVAASVPPRLRVGSVEVPPGRAAEFVDTAPLARIESNDPVALGDTVALGGYVFNGTPPFEFAWDLYGDTGYDAIGQYVEHAYAEVGTYTVRLQVMDAGGCTDLVTRNVVVYP